MKRIVVYRILMVLYLIGVAVLCFANFNKVATRSYEILGLPADKVVHFLMFFPFAVLGMLSFRRVGVVRTLMLIVGLYLSGCLMAWGTEYVQGLLPYREMDMEDFRADRMGLAAGAVTAFLIRIFVKAPRNA